MCNIRKMALSALANRAGIEVQARRLLTVAHKSKYTAKNINFNLDNIFEEDDMFDDVFSLIVFKYVR